jgi:hypothetical protein
MTILLVALLLAQDPADARDRADEARRKCASLVAGTDGLTSIGMAGSGTDYKLLLVVRDPAVKKSIQDRLGGDRCDGLPIVWSVKNPTAQALSTPAAPAPVPAGEETDPATLDCYRHRYWPTYTWISTTSWGRPLVVWTYRNGWNGHKLYRGYYGWYYYWR